ncbi:hypothetical protein D3C76_919180 [compost metagenome]
MFWHAPNSRDFASFRDGLRNNGKKFAYFWEFLRLHFSRVGERYRVRICIFSNFRLHQLSMWKLHLSRREC